LRERLPTEFIYSLFNFEQFTRNSLACLLGFVLPYRLVFAVATLDSLIIYDTQRSGPIIIFAGIHYAAITDIAWYKYSPFPSKLMDLLRTCYVALFCRCPDTGRIIVVLFWTNLNIDWVEVSMSLYLAEVVIFPSGDLFEPFH
jgi:hypothetical protein